MRPFLVVLVLMVVDVVLR